MLSEGPTRIAESSGLRRSLPYFQGFYDDPWPCSHRRRPCSQNSLPYVQRSLSCSQSPEGPIMLSEGNIMHSVGPTIGCSYFGLIASYHALAMVS